MTFLETDFQGLWVINLEEIVDDRGFFARCFCEDEFYQMGLNTEWPQINCSQSLARYTLRGLHFQLPPHQETKVVRCIAGAVWDVVVDLRMDSETFGKSFALELSSINKKSIYVPEGFAHGFISLAPNSEILYLVSRKYAPEYERTLLWNDSSVAIDWPASPSVVSEKDSAGRTLQELTSELGGYK